MPQETPRHRVQFLLDQHPADVPPPPPQIDQPPPWEPKFEELSPSQSPRRRPLDPPPPCFSTPSPLRIRSRDFPPFRIPALSERLTDGFRLLYPCNVLERHGIHRTDWVRLLEDLRTAARLSHQGLSAVSSRAPVAPLLTHHIFPSRTPGAVYDARFARGPAEEVCALLQIWNQCALERRKLRVALQAHTVGTSGKRSYALVVEAL